MDNAPTNKVAVEKIDSDTYMLRRLDRTYAYVGWNPLRASNAAHFKTAKDARSFADAHGLELNSDIAI